MAKTQVPQKLNQADFQGVPPWGDALIRTVNDIIEQLLNVMGSLTFSDNFRCEYVVGMFQHGVARNVRLATLRTAGGGLSLGAVGAVVSGFMVQGSSTPKQARVTFWFAGSPSTSVKASCILLDDGVAGDAAGSPPGVATLGRATTGPTTTTNANDTYTAPVNITAGTEAVYVGAPGNMTRADRTTYAVSGTNIIFSVGYIPDSVNGEKVVVDCP